MNSDAHRPEQPAREGLVHHPLFPAIGTLWVASLLIFAAMAVPASLLEHAAAAVRLDQLVPAASPPLGFTARLLLAFALALGGGAAGWLGALALRRRAAWPIPSARPASEPTPAIEPEPLTLPSDDDEDFARLAAARKGPGQRRRALTSETAELPSILEISAIPALEPITAEPATSPPIDLPASPQPGAERPADRPVRFRTLTELGGAAAARLCLAPLENLTVVQLVERFALALQARRQGGAPGPEGLGDQVGQAAPFAEPRAAHERPAPIATGRPFDMPADPDSDLVAAIAGGTLPEPQPESEGDDANEELVSDPAASDDYSSLAGMRPATRIAPPLADFVRVEDHDAGPVAEIGPQPVVVFPGQAAPAPPLAPALPGVDGAGGAPDTEAALREALAALRRMSGAA